MKPWPDAIRARYPIDKKCDHPARPWWTWVNLNPPTRLSDDVSVHHVPIYGWLRTDGRTVKASTEAKVKDFDLAEMTDREFPMLRPLLRALQVWSDFSGNAVTLLSVHGDSALCVDFIQLNENTGTIGPTHFNISAYPYLVADPLCPVAAPWSAAEVRPSPEQERAESGYLDAIKKKIPPGQASPL